MYLILVAALVLYLYKAATAGVFPFSEFSIGFVALVGAGAGLQWFNDKGDK